MSIHLYEKRGQVMTYEPQYDRQKKEEAALCLFQAYLGIY